MKPVVDVFSNDLKIATLQKYYQYSMLESTRRGKSLHTVYKCGRSAMPSCVESNQLLHIIFNDKYKKTLSVSTGFSV